MQIFADIKYSVCSTQIFKNVTSALQRKKSTDNRGHSRGKAKPCKTSLNQSPAPHRPVGGQAVPLDEGVAELQHRNVHQGRLLERKATQSLQALGRETARARRSAAAV